MIAFLALFPIEARIFGLFGRANPHTQNDNTSGVIAVLALVEKLKTRGDVAFVLFDNEESGLWGSRFLRKNLPNAKIINIDCVSDGTKFLMSINNGFARLYESVLKKFDPSDDTRQFIICSPEKGDKAPEWINYKQIKLASDHKHFVYGAGITAVDESGCIFRLHTPQDTVFDWENIEFLSNALVDFTQIALKRK